MTPADAAELLTRAAAYDQRTIGESDAQAWAAALPDITLDEAAPAVAAWYARRRDRIMPSDVRGHVVAARNERHARAPVDQRLPLEPTDPHAVGDIEYACLAWVGGWRQVQGDGPAPPYRLAYAVARSAAAWAATGMSRTDLSRAMWAAGRDSVILPAPPGTEPVSTSDEPFQEVPA